jgi:hypothetical protein
MPLKAIFYKKWPLSREAMPPAVPTTASRYTIPRRCIFISLAAQTLRAVYLRTPAPPLQRFSEMASHFSHRKINSISTLVYTSLAWPPPQCILTHSTDAFYNIDRRDIILNIGNNDESGWWLMLDLYLLRLDILVLNYMRDDAYLRLLTDFDTRCWLMMNNLPPCDTADFDILRTA